MHFYRRIDGWERPFYGWRRATARVVAGRRNLLNSFGKTTTATTNNNRNRKRVPDTTWLRVMSMSWAEASREERILALFYLHVIGAVFFPFLFFTLNIEWEIKSEHHKRKCSVQLRHRVVKRLETAQHDCNCSIMQSESLPRLNQVHCPFSNKLTNLNLIWLTENTVSTDYQIQST